MISQYDGKRSGRWSATGIVASLMLVAVAFTGGVRGQAAAPANPAQERKSNKPAPPGTPAPAPAAGITQAEAEKLWADKYADRIFIVEGKEANRHQVEQEYVDELKALGGVRPEPARRTRRAGDGPEEAAAQAQLDRPLPEVNFEGAALTDVIDFLRDVSGANIFVDWGALEAGGVSGNQPVSVRLKNIAFGHALELILRNAGGGTVPLDYTIDRGVIKISTGEHIDALTDIRAYDVRDVVPAEMDMKELVLLIQEAVAPNAWGQHGGGSAIRASKHKLIVSTNRGNHQQIENILGLLREDPSAAQADGNRATARGR